MTRHFGIFCLSLILGFGLSLGPADGLYGQEASQPESPRKQAMSFLERGLAEAAKPKAGFDALYRAVLMAAAVLGPDSRHGALILKEALRARSASTNSAATLERLRQVSETHLNELKFVPVMSADRPQGWPGYTVVGEIEVKKYPKYRMARAPMGEQSREMSSFWTLFQHIQKNEIAMTAPVETAYTKDGSKKPRALSMAFLYADTKLGQTGKDGKVDVVDVAPQTVVSFGARGVDRRDRVNAMEEELEAWLAQRPGWKRAGPTRVMGWNGPRVRGQRRYFEVQIPIEPVKEKPTKVVGKNL